MFRVFHLKKGKVALATGLVVVLTLIFAAAVSAINPEPADNVKTVYLTFDDGPSPITASVLDVLKAKQVEATFFVVAQQSDSSKALYHRILEEGHSMGLHSFSHNYEQIYKSADAYFNDLDQLKAHLMNVTGQLPSIYRLPGGSTNSHASKTAMQGIVNRISREGGVYFDWNVRGLDDHAYVTKADQILQNVIKGAQRYAGKDLIILLHDDALRTSCPEAVGKIIDYFRAEGYQFKALTPETKPIQFRRSK